MFYFIMVEEISGDKIIGVGFERVFFNEEVLPNFKGNIILTYTQAMAIVLDYYLQPSLFRTIGMNI